MHGDAAIAGLTCILEDNLRSHRKDVYVANALFRTRSPFPME
jgi:hypothetical protein